MKEHLTTIGIIFLIGSAAWGLGRDNIQSQLQTSSILREKAQQATIKDAEAEIQKTALAQEQKQKQALAPLEQEARAAAGRIAVQRYEQNCRSPRNEAGEALSIAPGMELIDPTTGFSIPDGTPVCDSSGNTAVMRGGILTDFARLNDSPASVLSRDTYQRYFPPVRAAKINKRGATK